MADSGKRKASDSGDTASKEKKKRQWQTPGRRGAHEGYNIQPGDAGIWATCEKGKERKCVGQLRDLYQEYAEKLYGDDPALAKGDDENVGEDTGDIESEIQDEVKGMRKPMGKPLFQNVKIDVQCVLFSKTRKPVDPAEVVHAICRDALQTRKIRVWALKRLTPVTKIGKATQAGLEELATEVLAPYFHTGDGVSKSFRVQPTTRNHDKTLTRDTIIKTVASMVGEPHKVNLNAPDLTILVEVYKFHCGMSVVGKEFDELKRFNLAEICYPSAAREEQKKATEAKERQEGGQKSEEPRSQEPVVDESGMAGVEATKSPSPLPGAAQS